MSSLHIKTSQLIVVVGLVIFKDKILIVKRNEPEVENVHLKWEFPGGKIEFDETPEEAVIREVYEETGVRVKVKRLLPYVQTCYWDYAPLTQQTIIIGYECEFIKKDVRKPDHHVKEVKWVLIKDFSKYNSLPGGKEFLESLA